MQALSPVSLPLDLMRSTPQVHEGARQDKALKELEGIFLNLLLKEMRSTVRHTGLYGESPAQKMFQEMLDEVYAQKMAESGQLGIARVIGDQIAVQGRQREVREAMLQSGNGATMPLGRTTGAPPEFALPQVRSAPEFIPVKSRPKDADMFPVKSLQ